MSSESTPSLHQQVTLIQGSAIIVIAIYLLTGVVTHDQSRYTLFATIFAKSFVGLLCLSFCYLIYSSGPLLRTIIGYLALLGGSLIILALLAGSIAWLGGLIPFRGILAGHSPWSLALHAVMNACIAWAFAFSKVVRQFESQSTPRPGSTSPGVIHRCF